MYKKDYPIGTVKTTKVAYMLGAINSRVKDLIGYYMQKSEKSVELRELLDELCERLDCIESMCNHEMVENLEDWSHETE